MDAERRSLEGSTSYYAVESAGCAGQSQQKRQRCQVVMDLNIPLDPDLAVLPESQSNKKDKQIMEYDSDMHTKISSTNNIGGTSTSTAQILESGLDCFDFEDDDEECEDNDDEDYEYEFDPADDFNQYLADKFDDMDLPTGVEASVPWLQQTSESTAEGKTKDMTNYKVYEEINDEIQQKYKSFKQFDTVEDYSDHYYAKSKAEEKTRKDWAKRVQNDWKILEKDLPESIFVRIYEGRMDLLRAAIIGPAGTPYHDGIFFFDCHFPVDYPNSPPKVHYHSGGLRLNPNLYNCGKVCLSLLGTWHGSGCEKWNKANSTMLQVLVSIQALVLNEKPYFNEPGWEPSANTPHGEKNALEYNDSTFVLSCKTMLYSLRNPPKHFEDLIAGHFRCRGRTILMACKAYLAGLKVGAAIPDEEKDKPEDAEEKPSPAGVPSPAASAFAADVSHLPRSTFTSNVQHLFEELLMEFSVKGADVSKFFAEKVKTAAAPAAAH